MKMDLENTVDPFYQKVKDKKNLTAHDKVLLLQYRRELGLAVNEPGLKGQGLKAVAFYLRKLNAIYDKQVSRSAILNT